MRYLRFIPLCALICARIAAADGGFVWHNEKQDILEPEQKAVLAFENGWQDLILEVRIEGAPHEFGWIVPLPARPEMAPARARLFELLSKRTQSPWFQHGERVARMRLMQSATRGEVAVLEEKRVGIYDVTVLSATDGGSLAAWLAKHRFRLRAGARAILDSYARQGWVFVTMRIARDAQPGAGAALANGTIAPIHFRFRAQEPVYPLRISALMGSPSDILLYVVAPWPLVPRAGGRLEWRADAVGPWEWIGRNDHDSLTGPLQGRTGYLTKLRTHARPQHMEDVRFQRYDPASELRSRDPLHRALAATHLGWLQPPGADEALVDHLDARRTGIEAHQALWALGQIGTPLARATLARFSRRGEGMLRLEAMEALKRTLDVPSPEHGASRVGQVAAEPELWNLCLDLIDAPVPERDFGAGEVRRVAFDLLIERAPGEALPRLRQLRRDSPPDTTEPGTPGGIRGVVVHAAPARDDLLRYALAACGEAAALEELRSRLLATAGATRPEVLRRGPVHLGACNGYPSGYWIGEVFHCTRPTRQWSELGLAHELLDRRRDVRDRLYRLAAHDPRMTEAGRALLIGLLERAEPRDLDALRTVWRRALGPDSIGITVAVENLGDPWRPVRYNVHACAVAHALARVGEVGALVELAEALPPDQTALLGEVAYALATTGSDRALGVVTRYVVTEWSRAFERGATDTPPGRSRHPGQPAGWHPPPWDARYRIRAIEHYLTQAACDTAVLSRLMTDPALPGRFRLYWIERTPYYWEDTRALRATACRAAEAVAAAAGEDTLLAQAAREVRERLERRDWKSPPIARKLPVVLGSRE